MKLPFQLDGSTATATYKDFKIPPRILTFKTYLPMRRLLKWLALFVPFFVTPPAINGQPIQSARQAIGLQEIVNFQQVTLNKKFEKLDEAKLAYFQFSKVPDEKALSALEAKGIKVLSYHNDKTYLVAFPNQLSGEDLSNLQVVAFAPTTKEKKLATTLSNKMYPSHALTTDNRVKIAINFHKGFPKEDYLFVLEKYNIEILEDGYCAGSVLTIAIDPIDIDLIAEEPLISFIDVVTPPVETLNNEVRALQKVSYVNSANGFNLRGNGVVVGIGDGGELGDHLDFQDRVINYANGTYSSFGDHGDHVAGIVGGGGIINPTHRGMASEATLLIQKTSLVTYYTEDYFNDHNMVLTNNSYGTSFNCTSNGSYNYTSQNLDFQLRSFPEVLHVFAAGNSGTQTCSPYPAGFFTLLRYYQSSKNVLTVGNVTDTRTIKSNSSRGPASDGRLKPEICGVGTSITSTGRNFDYSVKSGTSMAAPAVTGTLALLYESYKNQNGSNPQGGLIKAIACNTADDLGNSGPDYTYGYGLINGRRAVETIQNGNYIIDALSDGDAESHTINVPANTKQIKVMLYWTDKEADPYPTKALVNDLDLVVTTSGGASYLPWVLNPDSTFVNDPATRQVDNLNNIEQVTIDNPASGNLTISVAGTEVPFGPQDYFIVYEFVTEDIAVTYPMGGEHFSATNVEPIQWDTDNNNTSTFTVEYSLNGGSSWIVIDNNVAADQRSLFWTVPAGSSSDAFIRVTKNTGGYTDMNTTAFSIFEMPQLVAAPACEGMVDLSWNPVAGVDYYEVLKYEGTEMISVDTTWNTTFLLDDENLVLGEQYWFSVKGKTNSGMETKRSDAQFCIPAADASCAWSNDLVAQAIIIPIKGRIKTNSELKTNEEISIAVKNIGDNTVSGIDLSYQINNGTVVTESYNQPIPSGETLIYTFDTQVNMSIVGTYSVDAWVTFIDDVDVTNNELIGVSVAEQLDNAPIDLTNGAVSFDFELTNSYVYESDEIGLVEMRSWDFETIVDGRMAAGTSNGVELLIDDEVSSIHPSYSNNAIYTINLETSNPADGLMMDFVYSNNNLFPLESSPELLNKVYVRGSDTDSWIEAYTMAEQETGWHTVDDLNLMTLMTDAGQTLSSSVQIRFEENGKGLLLDAIGIHDTQELPVDLVAFSVTKIDGDALVKWKTASEFNNQHFEVQVATSIDQIQNNDFTVLGIVPGIGTTSETNAYSFLDETPNKLGTYYYRLRQLDFDGKFDFSDIRQVEFTEDDNEVQVYPNPFAEYVLIGSDNSNFNNVKGSLYNSLGQLVDFFEIPVSGHSGTYRFDIRNELPTGNYYLHLNRNGHNKTIPLMKGE